MKYFLLFLIFTASCLNAFNLMEDHSHGSYLWFGGVNFSILIGRLP